MIEPLQTAKQIADLREQLAELERGIVLANDAAFAIAGIVCRILVEAQAIGREKLADAVEVWAGPENSIDLNPALQVFARALRMNLPGGRFCVIDGGRSGDLDPAEVKAHPHAASVRLAIWGDRIMPRIMRLIPLALAGLMVVAMPTQLQAQAQPKPRNYDCTKAGNANKAVCKAQAAPAAPAAPARPGPKIVAERHYDCSKAGNANKTVCKGVATAAPAAEPAPTPPVARPTPTRPSVAAAPAAVPGNGNPTAKCRDNTLSYSVHRSGTCSRHGGVASWY